MCSTDPVQTEGREYGEVAAQPVPLSTAPWVAKMLWSPTGLSLFPYLEVRGQRRGAFSATGGSSVQSALLPRSWKSSKR